jgi:hypothetical protein
VIKKGIFIKYISFTLFMEGIQILESILEDEFIKTYIGQPHSKVPKLSTTKESQKRIYRVLSEGLIRKSKWNDALKLMARADDTDAAPNIAEKITQNALETHDFETISTLKKCPFYDLVSMDVYESVLDYMRKNVEESRELQSSNIKTGLEIAEMEIQQKDFVELYSRCIPIEIRRTSRSTITKQLSKIMTLFQVTGGYKGDPKHSETDRKYQYISPEWHIWKFTIRPSLQYLADQLYKIDFFATAKKLDIITHRKINLEAAANTIENIPTSFGIHDETADLLADNITEATETLLTEKKDIPKDFLMSVIQIFYPESDHNQYSFISQGTTSYIPKLISMVDKYGNEKEKEYLSQKILDDPQFIQMDIESVTQTINQIGQILPEDKMKEKIPKFIESIASPKYWRMLLNYNYQIELVQYLLELSEKFEVDPPKDWVITSARHDIRSGNQKSGFKKLKEIGANTYNIMRLTKHLPENKS